MTRASISVVVVSFEVRELLRRCLETVVRQDPEPELWVVDNHSEDGSASMVAECFPSARLIRNEHNVGFASANNQALARAGGDVLLLLNPDTELPDGALGTILEVFARHPRAGAVGLELRNPDGTAQPWCFSFPGLANQAVEAFGLHRIAARLGYGTPSVALPPPRGEGPVDWVSGACFAISRRAFETVGGLDDSSFMYGEEPDWCWRARRAGFTTIASTAARVVHHGGASGEGRRGELFVRHIEARLAFMKRHRGALRASLAREILTLGALLRWLAWRARTALAGGASEPRATDQLERFRAVLAWRFRGGR